ncbi:MAG: hypothetical protein CW716_10520 [Candidatus Bathyarchaeum sp.]|nr:MAG: hypothetical protein CW716_10520 [Candidatus Bathyarchaeum sp.]
MKELVNFWMLIIFFILSVGLIGLVGAESSSPAWLKEGTYVKYSTDQVGYAYLFNNSGLSGINSLSFWNATFGWRCVSINDTVAKLEFTFDYVGKTLNDVSLENATLQLAGEVYVDIYTRAMYASNGSLLGTTHMWVTANPTEGQDVVVWDIPPERVTLPAKVNGVWFQTIQGKQDGFNLEGTETVNGKAKNFGLLCDLDTGLMVDGNFEWDPIITGAGIKALLLNGRIILSDTNIALTITSDNSKGSFIFVFISLSILAFVILFVAFYKRIHQKRKH